MKSIHCFSLVSGNSRYNPKLSMSRHFHEISKNNSFNWTPVNIPFIQILKQIVNVVLGNRQPYLFSGLINHTLFSTSNNQCTILISVPISPFQICYWTIIIQNIYTSIGWCMWINRKERCLQILISNC